MACLENGHGNWCLIHELYIRIGQKSCSVKFSSSNAWKDHECRKFACRKSDKFWSFGNHLLISGHGRRLDYPEISPNSASFPDNTLRRIPQSKVCDPSKAWSRETTEGEVQQPRGVFKHLNSFTRSVLPYPTKGHRSRGVNDWESHEVTS